MGNYFKKEYSNTEEYAKQVVCRLFKNKHKLFFGRLYHPVIINLIFSKYFCKGIVLYRGTNRRISFHPLNDYNGIAYSCDGKSIISFFGKIIKSWDTIFYNEIDLDYARININSNDLHNIANSPCGNYTASISGKNIIVSKNEKKSIFKK